MQLLWSARHLDRCYSMTCSSTALLLVGDVAFGSVNGSSQNADSLATCCPMSNSHKRKREFSEFEQSDYERQSILSLEAHEAVIQPAMHQREIKLSGDKQGESHHAGLIEWEVEGLEETTRVDRFVDASSTQPRSNRSQVMMPGYCSGHYRPPSLEVISDTTSQMVGTTYPQTLKISFSSR